VSEEEKEQWLYEEYKYTSNFDFNRLDKYEEANNDLCIDDLILDYTMLYEYHKKEIERLNKERNKTYENGLNYFLKLQEKKDEIERLNNIINELEKWLEERLEKLDINGYDDDVFNGIELVLQKLQELKGSDKE
jgi:hypothetical protein